MIVRTHSTGRLAFGLLQSAVAAALVGGAAVGALDQDEGVHDGSPGCSIFVEKTGVNSGLAASTFSSAQSTRSS
jgi:hypothetical protein